MKTCGRREMVISSTMLQELISVAIAACQGAINSHGPLWLALFLTGLVGSATHCVGMCGPFVMSQTVARLETIPAQRMTEFQRLAGGALVPYHLGRMTTYVILGAIAGGLAETAIHLTGFSWISSALLLLAAVVFAGYAISRLTGRSISASANRENGLTSLITRRMRPFFEQPIGFRGYTLGVMLGFLPCGLLYAAWSAAAASGSAVAGGVAMAAFAMGTVPALVIVGYASRVAGTHWRGLAVRALPVILFLNATALSYMAFRSIA
jgi:sulfite exporter TauE/SafE